MDSSYEGGLDTTNDFTTTRHSSKLSLGSSPSVLSGDEEEETSRLNINDGSIYDKDRTDGHDTIRTGHGLEGTTMDNQTNGSVHHPVTTTAAAPATSPVAIDTAELDEIHMDQDSASPLSSVPEDFPLSRSASPELLEDDPDNNPLFLLSSISVPADQTTNKRKSIQDNHQQHSKRHRPSDFDEGQDEDHNRDNISTSEAISSDDGATDRNESLQPASQPRRISMIGRDTSNQPTTVPTSIIDHEGESPPLSLSKLSNTTLTTHYPPPQKDTLAPPSPTGNDEKENAPIATNDNGHRSISKNTAQYIDSLEDQENISTKDDDWDTQQRHKDALDALTHIEVEFARLREKMYQEKMAELNEEAIMIANGTHPELITLMAEIEEKKGRRISTAEAWRKYQHTNFRRQFEGFEYQANVHFISRKSAIRKELLATTHGKRWRLEDEQSKLNDPVHRSGKVIPDMHTLGLQKQVRRKKTMDLQDINDVIGFPRAPQVPGLSQQDIQDDLLILGLGASASH
ncbi:hypothetical protein [Absidia glauca]|uniref:Sds3-like-domain-containing protein n=1 Tax=Absidia glauca TaxID=4829 RepID=A0A168QN88_ABSGL|nr:hypothetical protein [Absidia glauca]